VDEDDAHAWSEFWSEKERRWIRVDPTRSVPGATPPNHGRTAGMAGQLYEAFISETRLYFEENPGSALALSLTLFFAFLSGILAFSRKKAGPEQKLLEIYRSFCRRGAKSGFPRIANEGPEDYRIRLATALPGQAPAIGEFIRIYQVCRYGQRATDAKTLREFRQALRRITFRDGTDRDSGFRKNANPPKRP
jgi:hypothetical protein